MAHLALFLFVDLNDVDLSFMFDDDVLSDVTRDHENSKRGFLQVDSILVKWSSCAVQISQGYTYLKTVELHI